MLHLIALFQQLSIKVFYSELILLVDISETVDFFSQGHILLFELCVAELEIHIILILLGQLSFKIFYHVVHFNDHVTEIFLVIVLSDMEGRYIGLVLDDLLLELVLGDLNGVVLIA